jgi:hypothetical protein
MIRRERGEKWIEKDDSNKKDATFVCQTLLLDQRRCFIQAIGSFLGCFLSCFCFLEYRCFQSFSDNLGATMIKSLSHTDSLLYSSYNIRFTLYKHASLIWCQGAYAPHVCQEVSAAWTYSPLSVPHEGQGG